MPAASSAAPFAAAGRSFSRRTWTSAWGASSWRIALARALRRLAIRLDLVHARPARRGGRRLDRRRAGSVRLRSVIDATPNTGRATQSPASRARPARRRTVRRDEDRPKDALSKSASRPGGALGMLDISRPLDDRTRPWPGDVGFSSRATASLSGGDPYETTASRWRRTSGPTRTRRPTCSRAERRSARCHPCLRRTGARRGLSGRGRDRPRRPAPQGDRRSTDPLPDAGQGVSFAPRGGAPGRRGAVLVGTDAARSTPPTPRTSPSTGRSSRGAWRSSRGCTSPTSGPRVTTASSPFRSRSSCSTPRPCERCSSDRQGEASPGTRSRRRDSTKGSRVYLSPSTT